MTNPSNQQKLRTAFAAMAEGNTRPFGELMADDCRWVAPGQHAWAGTWQGKAAMNAQLFGPLYKRFAGKYSNHATRFIGDGDVVAVEAQGRALLKNGQRYDNTYCFVCEFGADGLLRQVTEYMDSALAERVLGTPDAEPR